MPDLGEQLSAILQNPEAQQNIRALLSSMQQGAPQQNDRRQKQPDQSRQQQSQNQPRQNSPPQQNDFPFDLSALFGGGAEPSPPQNSGGGFDMGMLLKLQQIFSKMSFEDNNICLLKALRPFLREPKKADEAIHILQLLSVLPALGEAGIFRGG